MGDKDRERIMLFKDERKLLILSGRCISYLLENNTSPAGEQLLKDMQSVLKPFEAEVFPPSEDSELSYEWPYSYYKYPDTRYGR